MLGRYVAGTVLVLGVAMLMAPPPDPASEDDAMEVTRSDATPVALAAPTPVALPEPTPQAEAAPAVSSDNVQAAVLEALNLDVAEDSDRPVAQATDTDTNGTPLAGDSSATAEAGEDAELPEVGVLAGLSDPGFFAGGTVAIPENADGTPDAQPVAPQPTASVQYRIVTGNRVNVRSGPSTEYRVVGSVVRGDPVELIGIGDDGWAQILINDGQQMGFMSGKFLAQDLAGG